MSQASIMHDPVLLTNARKQLSECVTFKEIQDLLLNLLSANHDWRSNQCLNLVAAEAPMSMLARSVLTNDLSIRTAGGHIGEHQRYFMATRNIDQIESLCHELLKILFQCGFCDHRLLSGTQACHIVYATLTKPGDTIISVLPEQGGAFSNNVQGIPGLLNLNMIAMPFLKDQVMIDLERLDYLVEKHKPKLISLGFSVCLFQQPLREIKEIATENQVQIFYDAAHELGLIAGKCFDNPFVHGVDIVSGSTGKTFSGPQGGLLLWNNEQMTSSIIPTITPRFVGTYLLNHMMALTLTALEFKQYGEMYMQQVVRNAKTLANNLYDVGLPVFAKERNFTETHQVLMNAEKYGGGYKAAKRLESCNIISNHAWIPGDSTLNGLRLALTEMTRRGMQSSHMQDIAAFIYRALETQESSQNIAHEVQAYCQEFQTIYYCEAHPYVN